MSETTLGLQAIGGLVGVVLASTLYMLGGRSGKWKRRFVGSAILAITVNVLFVLRGLWSPWYLLTFPMLIGGFSMGYGADELGAKILRRSIYALGVCASGVLIAVVHGVPNGYWLLIPHIGVGAFSIFLGVKSILPAAVEEVAVCMVLNLFLVFYPFVT